MIAISLESNTIGEQGSGSERAGDTGTGRERRTERGKGRTTISPSIFVLFCLPHHIRVPQPHSVRSFLLRRSLGALTDGCAADSPVTARTGDTETERGREGERRQACVSLGPSVASPILSLEGGEERWRVFLLAVPLPSRSRSPSLRGATEPVAFTFTRSSSPGARTRLGFAFPLSAPPPPTFAYAI